MSERKLTPDLVRKTEAVNDRRSDQQIGLFKLTFLHFALSGDIKSGNGGSGSNGVPGIFGATSTGIQTPRGSGLTRINGVGLLLRQGEGVVRI